MEDIFRPAEAREDEDEEEDEEEDEDEEAREDKGARVDDEEEEDEEQVSDITRAAIRRQESAEDRKGRLAYDRVVQQLRGRLMAGNLKGAQRIFRGDMLGADNNVLTDIIRGMVKNALAVSSEEGSQRLLSETGKVIDTCKRLGLSDDDIMDEFRSIMSGINEKARTVLVDAFDFAGVQESVTEAPRTFLLLGLEFREDMERPEALRLLREISKSRFATIGGCASNTKFVNKTKCFVLLNISGGISLHEFVLSEARAVLPDPSTLIKNRKYAKTRLWALYALYIFDPDKKDVCREVIKILRDTDRGNYSSGARPERDVTVAVTDASGGESKDSVPDQPIKLTIGGITFCTGRNKNDTLANLRELAVLTPEVIDALSRDGACLATAKKVFLQTRTGKVSLAEYAVEVARSVIERGVQSGRAARWAIYAWLLFGNDDQKAEARSLLRPVNADKPGEKRLNYHYYLGPIAFKEGASTDATLANLKRLGKFEPNIVAAWRSDGSIGARAENVAIGNGSERDFLRRFAVSEAHAALKLPPASTHENAHKGYPRWAIYVLAVLGNAADKEHALVHELFLASTTRENLAITRAS